jgi:lipoate-protein ligase B
LKNHLGWLIFSAETTATRINEVKMTTQNATDKGPRTTDTRPWYCLEFDALDYRQALKLQHRLVDARKSGAVDRNMLLLLEHPPVFTLGRRGGRDNLRVSEGFLTSAGIEVVQVERGGNITYHGPGQLVAYLICDLEAGRLGVKSLVDALEELMIRTAAAWEVQATRNAINRGVWIGNRKMGSVGIAVRKGVSYHGLALNANLSLEPFSWINPCGMTGVDMTSIQNETIHTVAMPDVRRAFKRQFESVFRATLERISVEDIEKRMGVSRNSDRDWGIMQGHTG